MAPAGLGAATAPWQNAGMTDAPSDSDNLVLLRDALAPLWEEARDMAELKRRLGRPASRELAWLRPVMVAGAAVYREGESWRCEILVEGGPSGRGRLAPNALPGGREAALTLLLGMLCDACLGAVADVSEDAATAPACERANSEPPEHPGPHAEAVPADVDRVEHGQDGAPAQAGLLYMEPRNTAAGGVTMQTQDKL